jgi:hypothetical protein
VKSGELGRVLNLRGLYGKSKIISFESDWRTKRSEAGGGILLVVFESVSTLIRK